MMKFIFHIAASIIRVWSIAFEALTRKHFELLVKAAVAMDDVKRARAFQRTGFKRPFMVIAGIAFVGYAIRLYVIKQAHTEYLVHEEVRRNKLTEAAQQISDQAAPRMDYDRVWRGVLAREAVIERAERAAAAAGGDTATVAAAAMGAAAAAAQGAKGSR